MKTTIWLVTILLATCMSSGRAQGLLGFFHQQANKKKLMVAQVAALTVFDRQHAMGYLIDDRGLMDAHGQESEELEAHDAYYNSLTQIRPAVHAPEKKKALMDYQTRIMAAFETEISWQQKHQGLRKNELEYLVKVSDGMRGRCAADISEMEAVTTPGKLQLTDAERLERLDKLMVAMQDKYAFTLSFTGKCRKLALARAAQRKDQEQIQKLYGN